MVDVVVVVVDVDVDVVVVVVAVVEVELSDEAVSVTFCEAAVSTTFRRSMSVSLRAPLNRLAVFSGRLRPSLGMSGKMI